MDMFHSFILLSPTYWISSLQPPLPPPPAATYSPPPLPPLPFPEAKHQTSFTTSSTYSSIDEEPTRGSASFGQFGGAVQQLELVEVRSKKADPRSLSCREKIHLKFHAA